MRVIPRTCPSIRFSRVISLRSCSAIAKSLYPHGVSCNIPRRGIFKRQANDNRRVAVARADAKKAIIHRMVMPDHTCPYGLKALDLLKRQGFEVDDHWLKTRQETDAFKAKHNVQTTPQIFISGARIGGYDDLRRYLGKRVRDPE